MSAPDKFDEMARVAVECSGPAMCSGNYCARIRHNIAAALRKLDADAREDARKWLLAALRETDEAYGTSWVETVTDRCDDFDAAALIAKRDAEARADEREACAKVADPSPLTSQETHTTRRLIAKTIRARGGK